MIKKALDLNTSRDIGFPQVVYKNYLSARLMLYLTERFFMRIMLRDLAFIKVPILIVYFMPFKVATLAA